MDISSRFPKHKEIIAVYAIIVLLIYGWTILRFSYNLPGWLYFLSLGEIGSIFAYSMVVNLFESLLVLLIVISLALVIPKKWFGDAFIARGASFSILALDVLMITASQFKTRDDYPADLIGASPFLLLMAAAFAYVLGTDPHTRRILEWLADRAIIFLYITIPISIISLTVVLFRVIF